MISRGYLSKKEAGNLIQQLIIIKSIMQQEVEKQKIGEDINSQNQRDKLSEKQQNEPEQQQGKPALSKKQLKKLQKKQKWEQIKRIKRKEDREKQKIKKKQKKKVEQDNQQKGEENDHKFLKRRKDEYKQKMQGQLRVVIDLQFYELMTEKQQTSLAKQLAYSHSVNRRMENPFNYILSSVKGETLKFLADKYNIDNYGITIRQQSILDLFDKKNIVYLTGDAEEDIMDFDPNDIYVIGGIVDHNRLKNITINWANQNNIRARRLPMEGVKLKASVHLAVNHVWEWMLRKYNGQSWLEAIRHVIPERKLQDEKKEVKLQKKEEMIQN